MMARVMTLALPILLIGLVSPHNLAWASDYALAPRGEVRVVSQQKSEEEKSESEEEKKPADESLGPMDVFSDIEKGWNAELVDLILKHFGDGKVTISIEGTSMFGGNFSRNQSFYLLTDMFKYTITKKFEIVQYRKPSENGHSSFAVAERSYQKTDDGRLFKDKIFLSLHLEPGAKGEKDQRWVVDEIKSIR